MRAEKVRAEVSDTGLALVGRSGLRTDRTGTGSGGFPGIRTLLALCLVALLVQQGELFHSLLVAAMGGF